MSSDIRMRDHFTRFICPIDFAQGFFQNLVNNHPECWQIKPILSEIEDHLLPHIGEYLQSKDQSHDADEDRSRDVDTVIFEWKEQSLRKKIPILNSKRFTFTCDYAIPSSFDIRHVIRFEFIIQTIEVYVFKTGTGFLVLETKIVRASHETRTKTDSGIEIETLDDHFGDQIMTEDLIHFNHSLRSFQKHAPRIFIPREYWTDDVPDDSETMSCPASQCKILLDGVLDSMDQESSEEAWEAFDCLKTKITALPCDDKKLLQGIQTLTKKLPKQPPSRTTPVDCPPKPIHQSIPVKCKRSCFKFREYRSPNPSLSPAKDLIVPGFTLYDLFENLARSLHPELNRDRLINQSSKYVYGFTFVLSPPQTTPSEETISAPLFHLRRFSRSSYAPAPDDLRISGNPEILRTFQNIFFGISLEGGAVFAQYNHTRFMNGFVDIVRNRYAVLYLLALHQKCIFSTIALDVIKIPESMASEKLTRSAMNDIRRERWRIVNIILRNRFYQISNTTQHQLFYEKCCDILKIEPLLIELKQEIVDLDDLLKSQLIEQEQRLINMIQVIISFTVPIGLFAGIFGMNLLEFNDLSAKSPLFLVSAGFIFIIVFVLLFCYFSAPTRKTTDE